MKLKKMTLFATGFSLIVLGAMANEECFKVFLILIGFLFIYFADGKK